jgi:hypothetical protein
LDPANGDNGRPDQAVPVVQIERQRDVLTVMSEQVTSDLCCCGRVIDPTREVEPCIGNSIRVSDGGNLS